MEMKSLAFVLIQPGNWAKYLCGILVPETLCITVMAPDLCVVVCIPPRKCSDFPHGCRKLKPLKTKEAVAAVQVGRESKERCCSHYSLITSAYEP